MRISESDHLKVKRIANRLGVRDSDMYRYAIKTILAKLSPLDHKNRCGSDVLPAFIECGKELASFFNLDSEKLNTIINNGNQNNSLNVEMHDIELIAMSALPDHFLQRKIQDLIKTDDTIKSNTDNILSEYLYEKYLRNNKS